MNPLRTAHHALVITATLALGLTACSSGDTTNPPPSTTAASPAPSSTPTSPAETAKQHAIAAYLGMWQDVAAVAKTSDWQSERLAHNATADALSVLSRAMYADHLNGLVTTGQPINNPEATSAEPASKPTTVLISDCGDSTNWLKHRADNGQLADNEAGGRRHMEAEVKLAVDGSWKVTRFAVQGIGTC
ncbi:hypothetical protein [Amycolatopsis sp. NBC_01480]|uniref:hypothetical protein n=1 Tax=Amycolatopsis sp. NBC_01480 TaxID=2903562 RepID=UPI002E299399|nr:hypothetical protein [Amycolatopsis sp. NBC_01480]